MPEITLARALKYKNRVIERLRKTEDDIRQFNSILEGGEREYDVQDLFKERLSLEAHLVDLKLRIDAANAPIKEAIVKMQELKGRLVFLQSVPTTHGKQQKHRNLYGDEGEVVYSAMVRKADIDEAISEVNTELDDLQEFVDKHNNTQSIDTPVLEF